MKTVPAPSRPMAPKPGQLSSYPGDAARFAGANTQPPSSSKQQQQQFPNIPGVDPALMEAMMTDPDIMNDPSEDYFYIFSFCRHRIGEMTEVFHLTLVSHAMIIHVFLFENIGPKFKSELIFLV